MNKVIICLVICISAIAWLYGFTRTSLVNCHLQTQSAMSTAIDSGEMGNIASSCAKGKIIFTHAVLCFNDVKSNSITKIFTPMIQKNEPKLTPEYYVDLQNQACVEYPESQIK